jgi:hypothetical protein
LIRIRTRPDCGRFPVVLPTPPQRRGTGNRELSLARSPARRTAAAWRGLGGGPGFPSGSKPVLQVRLLCLLPCSGGAEAQADVGGSSFRWTQDVGSPPNINADSRPVRAGTRLSGRFRGPGNRHGGLAKALQQGPSGATKGSTRHPSGVTVKPTERYRRTGQGSTPPSPPRGGRTFPTGEERRKLRGVNGL